MNKFCNFLQCDLFGLLQQRLQSRSVDTTIDHDTDTESFPSYRIRHSFPPRLVITDGTKSNVKRRVRANDNDDGEFHDLGADKLEKMTDCERKEIKQFKAEVARCENKGVPRQGICDADSEPDVCEEEDAIVGQADQAEHDIEDDDCDEENGEAKEVIDILNICKKRQTRKSKQECVKKTPKLTHEQFMELVRNYFKPNDDDEDDDDEGDDDKCNVKCEIVDKPDDSNDNKEEKTICKTEAETNRLCAGSGDSCSKPLTRKRGYSKCAKRSAKPSCDETPKKRQCNVGAQLVAPPLCTAQITTPCKTNAKPKPCAAIKKKPKCKVTPEQKDCKPHQPDKTDQEYKTIFRSLVGKIQQACSSSTGTDGGDEVEKLAMELYDSWCRQNCKDKCGKWMCLEGWEKLRFFWAAIRQEDLYETPFENFKNFFMKEARRMCGVNIDLKKLNDEVHIVWHTMINNQRWPFIYESLIYQISIGKVNLQNECDIRTAITRLRNNAGYIKRDKKNC